MKRYILIISSSQHGATLFSSLLQHLQQTFRCMYATSVNEALSLLKFIKPEIIFIDAKLKSKYESAGLKLIKTLPAVKSKTVIEYLAGEEEIIFKDTTLGGKTVCKPVNVAAMAKSLENLVQ